MVALGPHNIFLSLNNSQCHSLDKCVAKDHCILNNYWVLLRHTELYWVWNLKDDFHLKKYNTKDQWNCLINLRSKCVHSNLDSKCIPMHTNYTIGCYLANSQVKLVEQCIKSCLEIIHSLTSIYYRSKEGCHPSLNLKSNNSQCTLCSKNRKDSLGNSHHYRQDTLNNLWISCN